MQTRLEGKLAGLNYTGIISLHFLAESIQDELTLKRMLEYYQTLSAQVSEEPRRDDEWVSVDELIRAENGCPDFSEIMLEFYAPLTESEISRASGCLGYALKKVLAGEDLSEPEARQLNPDLRLVYYYDSTKSRRDDPDPIAAFEKAMGYIQEGTPIRKTDRAGYGTRGTRLVEGIGPRRFGIYVR